MLYKAGALKRRCVAETANPQYARATAGRAAALALRRHHVRGTGRWR